MEWDTNPFAFDPYAYDSEGRDEQKKRSSRPRHNCGRAGTASRLVGAPPIFVDARRTRGTAGLRTPEKRAPVEDNCALAVTDEKRVLAEEKRVLAEEKRVLAEEKRVLAEEKRTIAEEKGRLAEDRRVVDEEARQNRARVVAIAIELAIATSEECSICLEKLSDASEAAACDNGHVIHSECYRRVLKCPVCRIPLREPEHIESAPRDGLSAPRDDHSESRDGPSEPGPSAPRDGPSAPRGGPSAPRDGPSLPAIIRANCTLL